MRNLLACTLICFGLVSCKAKALGIVVERFEGVKQPCVIANTPKDPGGKSYGLYQFSLKKGTMERFIKEYGESLDLDGYEVGSKEFDMAYTSTCKLASEGFKIAQRAFAKKHYFNPVRKYADRLKISRTPAINEALFSIAIQHGRWKKIIKNAGKFETEGEWLASLYNARLGYVWSLKLDKRIKRNISLRYQIEFNMIVGIMRGTQNNATY